MMGQPGIRTHNLSLTRRMLYQLNYWTKAYEAFTSGHQLHDVSPSQMPGSIITKPPVAKFGQGFKPKFHRGDEFPITIKSLTPTSDEVSFLKAGEDPTVSCKKVANLKYFLWRNIQILSSLDELLTSESFPVASPGPFSY